jgi:hypothetical protein
MCVSLINDNAECCLTSLVPGGCTFVLCACICVVNNISMLVTKPEASLTLNIAYNHVFISVKALYAMRLTYERILFCFIECCHRSIHAHDHRNNTKLMDAGMPQHDSALA